MSACLSDHYYADDQYYYNPQLQEQLHYSQQQLISQTYSNEQLINDSNSSKLSNTQNTSNLLFPTNISNLNTTITTNANNNINSNGNISLNNFLCPQQCQLNGNFNCFFNKKEPKRLRIPDDKKQKRARILFSEDQVKYLEELFNHQKYLEPDDRKQVANKIGLSPQQVKIWFQNHRYKNNKQEKEIKKNGEIKIKHKSYRSAHKFPRHQKKELSKSQTSIINENSSTYSSSSVNSSTDKQKITNINPTILTTNPTLTSNQLNSNSALLNTVSYMPNVQFDLMTNWIQQHYLQTLSNTDNNGNAQEKEIINNTQQPNQIYSSTTEGENGQIFSNIPHEIIDENYTNNLPSNYLLSTNFV
ncbi:hypothetical protein SNEBB_005619 [Seison nebaliae]|nr:hypothetical protein SNEBB_005619 [Seison nebaliae]